MSGLHFRIVGLTGLALLCFGHLLQAEDQPRSRVQFAAVHRRFSFSVPWNLQKPEIVIPLNLPNTSAGVALFIGHVKQLSPGMYDVVGGNLMVRRGSMTDITFLNIWEQRLNEAGTVVVTPQKYRGNLFCIHGGRSRAVLAF